MHAPWHFPGGMLCTMAPAALATPPPTCSNGAIAAPNATWGGACFRLLAQRASSLRQCVDWCSEQNMAPTCVSSAEENTFAAGLVPDDDWAYIGLYQNDTSGGPAEGWERCLVGDASGFTNWDQGRFPQPDDRLRGGFPEDCAVMTSSGKWRDKECVVPSALGRNFRCLCEGPSSPSDSFEQDLQVLEATVDAKMREAKARAAVVYPTSVVITFLPALLLLLSYSTATYK